MKLLLTTGGSSGATSALRASRGPAWTESSVADRLVISRLMLRLPHESVGLPKPPIVTESVGGRSQNHNPIATFRPDTQLDAVR